MPRYTRALLAVIASLAATAFAGRYEGHTQKAASGPKMKPVAATYFGGDGVEEFVAAGALTDGRIVAFGNAWGPSFPDSNATVLGHGSRADAPALSRDKGGDDVPNEDSPNRAGFLVVYAPDLSAVKQTVRFDFGVASVTTACVNGDDSVTVTGYYQDAIASVSARARHAYAAIDASSAGGESGGGGGGGKKGKGAAPSSAKRVYLANLTVSGQVNWVWLLPSHHEAPSNLWTDKKGNTYFEANGFTRISRGGVQLDKITASGNGGRSGVRAVDPNTGEFYVGGDRNTNTGREPWRQPFFYKYSTNGQRVDWVNGNKMGLWEWRSRGLRDGSIPGIQGDVSDSAIRFADWTSTGDLILGCWSDGGNSVLGKQPLDSTRPVPGVGIGMDNGGMKGANSLTHFIRLDPKTATAKWKGLWMAYYPQNLGEHEADPDAQKKAARLRGSPTAAKPVDVKVLDGDVIAFAGGAGPGLIQTPNAFWADRNDGRWYSGAFVAAVDKDMSQILFSSYLPGCENAHIARTKNGLVVVSRSNGSDRSKAPDGKDDATPTPVFNAVQAKLRGPFDGHILLLRSPD